MVFPDCLSLCVLKKAALRFVKSRHAVCQKYGGFIQNAAVPPDPSPEIEGVFFTKGGGFTTQPQVTFELQTQESYENRECVDMPHRAPTTGIALVATDDVAYNS